MPTKTISTVASEMMPQNSQRKSFVIQNEDTTDSVYIKKERPGNTTVSATDHDYKIFPGGTIGLNSQLDGEEAIQERWTCIASANTPRVAYTESENIKR